MLDVSSNEWWIQLPNDWQQKEWKGQGHFVGDGGSKAIYIVAWLAGTEEGSATDVAESNKASNLRIIDQMEGYRWRIVAEEIVRG